jgi:hypothetical protein
MNPARASWRLMYRSCPRSPMASLFAFGKMRKSRKLKAGIIDDNALEMLFKSSDKKALLEVQSFRRKKLSSILALISRYSYVHHRN